MRVSSRLEPPPAGAKLVFVARPIKMKNKSSGTRRWLVYCSFEDIEDAHGAIVYYVPEKRFWKWVWSAKTEDRIDAKELLFRVGSDLPADGKLTAQYLMGLLPPEQVAEAVAEGIIRAGGKT